MNEWLGVSASNTYRSAALLGNVERLPEELSSKTLVLTHLQMYWDYETNVFRSYGKIGIGNIMGHQINRMVDGMVTIQRRTVGDEIDIYLRMDNDTWVFFSYTRESMMIGSSERALTELIANTSERRRQLRPRPSAASGLRFAYMLPTTTRVDLIKRNFQQHSRQTPPSVTPGAPQVPSDVPIQQQPVTPPPQTPPDDDLIIEIE
jgi:hypothetical protein